MGNDLTRERNLAWYLATTTSNKPAYGWAKRHHKEPRDAVTINGFFAANATTIFDGEIHEGLTAIQASREEFLPGVSRLGCGRSRFDGQRGEVLYLSRVLAVSVAGWTTRRAKY